MSLKVSRAIGMMKYAKNWSSHTKGFAALPGATVGLLHAEFLKDYKTDMCV